MSLGRFTMRTRAFQGWAFRPWALAGGDGTAPVADPVYTRIGVLRGALKTIGSIEGASKTIGSIEGSSRKIGTLTGLDS